MKKIYVLSTGGTIASKKNAKTGLFTSGAMNADELVDRSKIHLDAELIVETFSQIPSNAQTFTNLLKLKERIDAVFTDSDVLGIVITHGTDTLEESSYFLSLCVQDSRPVVLTGAQRTTQEEGTDAYCNIQDAITAVSDAKCAQMGVMLLFNEHLYAPRYVQKNHTFSTNAFTSNIYGVLGFVDGDVVHVVQRVVSQEYYMPQAELPRIEIITFALGCDGLFIEAATKAGVAGIILDGFGRGHVTPQACEAISEAVKAGIFVVITSSCANGRVHAVYDFMGGVKDLEERGAIQGFDYAAKKARIKLMLLLASGIESKSEIQKAFAQ